MPARFTARFLLILWCPSSFAAILLFLISGGLWIHSKPRALPIDKTSTTMGSAEQPPNFKFESIPGFFQQADPATDPVEFNNTKENFGLIDQLFVTDTADTAAQPVWKRFERYVRHMNSLNRPDDLFYRVLYFGRHGEGYHNVAEAFYGTKEWDDKWSKLDGNGTISWFDARLTELGKSQALAAHAFLKVQLNNQTRMPAPESYYVSPLYRCLDTANLTWSNLTLPEDRPFKPTIKEFAREVLGEHTCDKRSTKSYIQREFPQFPFEEGFSEEDEVWMPDHRETHKEHDVRTRTLMTDIFSHDPSTFISITSHSGAIASQLRVFGHREFALQTGGMIPIFVKVTRIS